MKKIFYMLTVAFAAFAFVSCDDETVAVAPLEIEEAMVVFEAGGGQGLVKLSESGITAKSPQDWCTVSVSGDEVTVNVSVNDDMMARNSHLSISKGTETIYVTVTQQGVNMTLTPTSLTLADTGDSKDITVEVPDGVTVTATPSESWVSTTVSGNKITVTAGDNPTLNTLTATITVKAGELERAVAVSQSGKTPTAADIYGVYTVTAISYFNGSVTYTGVTIRQKTGNTVTITGIPHSAASYDATLNLTARTVSCPDLTPVNGITYGGNSVSVASVSGAPIALNIVGLGKLSTPVPTAESQWWGFYIEAADTWVDIYSGGTTWNRTAP